MKKLSVIGTVGLPPKYGGFEAAAEQITKRLAAEYNITVYCSSKEYNERPAERNGVRLKYIPLKANGIQSTVYDIVAMFLSMWKSDVILILGVSGCIILPLVRLLSRVKIVVNIDGLEWKRAKWNRLAKGVLKFSEKMAVKFTDAVVTDNKIIKDYVMDEYGVISNLIEYGGDNAFNVRIEKEFGEYPFIRDKYILAVCRIEPENNIHLILEAFYKTKSIPLVIVGNWESTKYGRDLKTKYSDLPDIYLIDAVYDQERLNLLRSNCFVYIHAYTSGGTNPSLVEAMSLKLPVVAFDINFNRETTENKALYFKDLNELSILVENIASYPLQKIADELYEVAGRRYRWDIISKKYSELFL